MTENPVHRSSGEDAVCGVAADPRAHVRPVSLAGRDRRHARPAEQLLLAGACGRVVEIGAGTGLNVDHYPDEVDELILVEPDAAMRRRLARRLQRHARVAEIVDAPAERLPLADASVDTVVSTLVLCTVDHPNARCARSHACCARMVSCCSSNMCAPSPRFLAAWQDHLLGPWRRFAGGCRCNRPTVELMRACGFAVDSRRRRRGAACRRSSARSRWAGRHGDLGGCKDAKGVQGQQVARA